MPPFLYCTFLSTLSLRRATCSSAKFFKRYIYFYPRSPCGERRLKLSWAQLENTISIHALLAESDAGVPAFLCCHFYFYPRSPCGERPLLAVLPARLNHFYPRSPCGERLCRSDCLYQWRNFYPRSPCGERRDTRYQRYGWLHISIHALLAESDDGRCFSRYNPTIFLSTLSLRRATSRSVIGRHQSSISIHALLAESDGHVQISRLLMRWISIHALLAESDAVSPAHNIFHADFYPRSPCGERPCKSF